MVNGLSKINIKLYTFPPYFGSGSTSGNADPDPGNKKNRDKLTYKSTEIIRIKFF